MSQHDGLGGTSLPNKTLIWTPAFVILNVVELKLVEEPELERRLGAIYREYRKRVLRFIPRRPASPRTESRPTSR